MRKARQMVMTDYATQLSKFVTHPKTTGAITPSSKNLAQKMVEWTDWESVNAVVQYGPGTGVFTEQIMSNLNPGAKFIAIEINPVFAEMTSTRFPRIKVHHDSVQNVHEICTWEGVSEVDVVISGIPWAFVSHADQESALDATLRVLRQGGQFVTFAYLNGLLLPEGQHFKKLLRQKFSHVETSSASWLNLPPAFVYRCIR